MNIKRPLIWILGGWILGEIVAGWLGVSFAGHTSLDAVMKEHELLASAVITGTVKQVDETDYGVQIILTDNQVIWNDQVLETHDMILREDSEEGSSHLLSFGPGNRIQVTGDIKPFSVPGNPGEFNQREYYRAKGIDYKVELEACQLLDDRSYWVAEKLENVRASVMDGIRQVAADEEEYGLYLAVILGDKSEMDDETKGLYQNGGISHLLAISGLHLSLIGMGIWKLLRRFYLPLIPAGVVSSHLLLAYVYMIGGSASAWRAWIMFTVMLIAGMIGRTYDLLSALGLAGILLLIDQPLYAWQAGFQLSFGAMAGIGIVCPVLTEWCDSGKRSEGGGKGGGQKLVGKIVRSLVFSISIQLATLPMVTFHFFQVPMYGILLNLIAIPLMSYALASALIGTLMGMVWLQGGVFISGTAHYVFQLLSKLCSLTETLPGAIYITGRPESWQIIVYYILLAGLLVWMNEKNKERKNGKIIQKSSRQSEKGILRKKLSIIGIYLISFLLLLPLPQTSLTVTMLDVGQGDGIVLQLPDGSTCLIDGGSTSILDVGEKRILPYLKHEGVQEISMIFLTHEDLDHINGISQILEDPAIQVDGIAIPAVVYDVTAWEELLTLAAEKNIAVYRLTDGDVWSCSGVYLKVIHPLIDFTPPNANSTSLVMKLTYKDSEVLFMGDLESEQEMELLESFSDIDVLKVGHHGSKGSTCQEFLKIVQPELSLISCGRNNLYGHPHEDTLERLAVAESVVLKTPEYGAITVEFDQAIKVRSWLQPDQSRGKE